MMFMFTSVDAVCAAVAAAEPASARDTQGRASDVLHDDDEHDDKHAAGEGGDTTSPGGSVLDPAKEAFVADEDEVVVPIKVDINDDQLLDGNVG